MTKVTAVVGAQYGSEGKGAVVEKLCHNYDVCVRTGGPNAGHTYYVDTPTARDTERGKPARSKVVSRGIPVGAANPNCLLVIGAGAVVDIPLLLEEIVALERLGIKVAGRLLLDSNAVVVTERYRLQEGGTAGQAHRLIGSTGEGVGPARMGKIARDTVPGWSNMLASELRGLSGIEVTDTAAVLNEMVDEGASVLLEGTQGSGLSLTHGEWPYVTSHDTNAAQLAADAGLSPLLLTDVVLVARTYPIRVAGNSGMLPLEVTWEEIGAAPEQTTVTKKTRRVGLFHVPTVRRAAMLNRPTEMALMFVDYWPGVERDQDWHLLPAEIRESIVQIEQKVGVPVTMVGTGPDKLSVRMNGHTVERPGPWPSRHEAYGEVAL